MVPAGLLVSQKGILTVARLAENTQASKGVCGMSEHIDTRRKLKSIPSIVKFDELLEASTLIEEDKEILRLHYLKGKDFRYIGDTLGYSEQTIKKRHSKALSKLGKLF